MNEVNQQWDASPVSAEDLIWFFTKSSSEIFNPPCEPLGDPRTCTLPSTSTAYVPPVQKDSQSSTRSVDDIYLSDNPWVYCNETGLALFQLDDNTVAYYQTIDPSGKMLRTVCSQYRHPAIIAVKDNYWALAESCPAIFLCWLLFKYIHLTYVPRESYEYAVEMNKVSQAIINLYEQDILDDDYIAGLLETLTTTVIVEDRALLSIKLDSPSITKRNIDTLQDNVTALLELMPKATIAKALSSYWVDTHQYIPTLGAMYGVKDTHTERAKTLRRAVKSKVRLVLTEDNIDSAIAITQPPVVTQSAVPVPSYTSHPLVQLADSYKENPSKALDGIAALAALLKNNS